MLDYQHSRFQSHCRKNLYCHHCHFVENPPTYLIRSYGGAFKNFTTLSTETFRYSQLRNMKNTGSQNIDYTCKQEYIPVGCVPPAAIAIFPAMHAPCHTCPSAMHDPCHACQPATHTPAMHAPCHACPHHAWPPAMHAPPHHACLPATLAPCGQNSWHTLLKILSCSNFVAAGNYSTNIYSHGFYMVWYWISN